MLRCREWVQNRGWVRPSARRLCPVGIGLLMAVTAVLASACRGSVEQASPPAAHPNDPVASTTHLSVRTTVASGPGPLADHGAPGYAPLGTLAPATTVTPLGRYGAYVRIQMPQFLQTSQHEWGYVPAAALADAQTHLAQLDVYEVPWLAIDLASRLALHPRARLTPGGLAVQNRNSTTYDDDTPLHLESTGSFKLTAQLATPGGAYGAIKFAAAPNPEQPAIAQPPAHPRLDLYTEAGGLYLQIHGDRESTPAIVIDLQRPMRTTVTVTFLDAQGRRLVVSDGAGGELTRLDVTAMPALSLPDGLFPTAQVHIGRVVAPGSELTVRDLSLARAPTGERAPHAPDYPSLRRAAAAHNIQTGALWEWLHMRRPGYWNATFRTFDTLILPDFTLASFWRGRGDYDFAPVDAKVAWAHRNGFAVTGTHLVWGLEAPDWLRATDYTRDEYLAILEEHVKTVAGRYRGRITTWSVANEATSRMAEGTDFWAQKIGPEYVALSLRWAHEAAPDATLVLNDYQNESRTTPGSITQEMLVRVGSLKTAGVPLHAVGMQMHLLLYGAPAPDRGAVIAAMQEFAALGVDVYITELDVDVTDVPGSPMEKAAYQASVYYEMARACIESGVCRGFATWGVSDDVSWLTCHDYWCLNRPQADPLLFDRTYRPKPAFWAVFDAFAAP